MPSEGVESNVSFELGPKASYVEIGFTSKLKGHKRFLEALQKCFAMSQIEGAWAPNRDVELGHHQSNDYLKRWHGWHGHVLAKSLERLAKEARACSAKGKKVIFIGNGGSAAIASHMAVDWTKNGRIRSIALNDAPTLTCLSNDFGYENVFAKQLEYYGANGDIVVIISTSGKSPNIVKAAQQASRMDLAGMVTLTGRHPENRLRKFNADLRIYVPCDDYGLVEISHMSLLHAVTSVEIV